MLQITPQMKILVALEPADFRKGTDGLVRLCKDVLQQDPFRNTGLIAERPIFWIRGGRTGWSATAAACGRPLR
ncbi:hypothetical protein GC176_07635 [bacterium]|nr:hypothetical protein [bacterium]